MKIASSSYKKAFMEMLADVGSNYTGKSAKQKDLTAFWPVVGRKYPKTRIMVIPHSTSKCNTCGFEDFRWCFESEAFPRPVIEPALN